MAGVCDPAVGVVQPAGGAGGGVLGTAIFIASEADLEKAFPNIAGVHTIDAPTIWTAPSGGVPITLTAGSSIKLVFPGSATALGVFHVALIGDVVGPLVSGESVVSGFEIVNINAAGSDFQVESLLGRAILIETLQLGGEDPGSIEDVFGAIVLRTLSVLAPSPTAVGMTLDGTIGIFLNNDSQAVAPGTSPYTAWTVEPTCVVTGLVAWIDNAWASQLSTDSYLDISTSATLPTGALPTTILGTRVTGVFRTGPGSLFEPGSVDEKDIKMYSQGNVNGPSSRYLGDAVLDPPGFADAGLDLSGSGAGTLLVVPPDNGPGPTATMALAAVSQRHTLTITSAVAPFVWEVRFDGPNEDLSGFISWSALVFRSGGSAAAIEGFIQVDTGSGFVTMTETKGVVGALPTTATPISGGEPITLNSGDRFRVVMSTDTPATDIHMSLIKLRVQGNP